MAASVAAEEIREHSVFLSELWCSTPVAEINSRKLLPALDL